MGTAIDLNISKVTSLFVRWLDSDRSVASLPPDDVEEKSTAARVVAAAVPSMEVPWSPVPAPAASQSAERARKRVAVIVPSAVYCVSCWRILPKMRKI
jgi:hypothetical protein